MSQKGIEIVAKVFSQLQLTRLELLRMGGEDAKSESGHQDMFLGQILEKGKEAMKDDFLKATLMKIT
jgi:hypothetical protein